MASGQQLSEGITRLLSQVEKRLQTKVPKHLQTKRNLEELMKHSEKKNSPEVDEFISTLAERSIPRNDRRDLQRISDKRDESIAYDPGDRTVENSRAEDSYEEPARPLNPSIYEKNVGLPRGATGADAPIDHDLPYPGVQGRHKEPMQRANKEQIYGEEPEPGLERADFGDHEVEGIYEQLQARQRPLGKKKDTLNRFDRAANAPSVPGKLEHHRKRNLDNPRNAERQALADEARDPKRVVAPHGYAEQPDAYRSYSDEVPVIEEGDAFSDVNDIIKTLTRAIADVRSGTLASGKTGLLDLKAALAQATGDRSQITNDAFRSGQRFSDLSTTRGRGQEVPLPDEGVAADDPMASQLGILQEFYNSMRNK